ncbi:30S ribosomal protein S16 [Candidatus Parcubacteria bacterium]|nr:30S ribosomal protein S16 [Candidatus Parcubacteria bacterium]
MLVIRFLRTGKKNQAFFRIVVTDKRNPPKAGRFLEILGFYNPLTKEKKIKTERIQHWISNGAKPSDRVHNLLISEGVIKGKKIAVHSTTKKKKKEGEKPEKKPKEPISVPRSGTTADKEKPVEKPEEPKKTDEKPAEQEKPAEKLAEPEKTDEKPEKEVEKNDDKNK